MGKYYHYFVEGQTDKDIYSKITNDASEIKLKKY